MVFELDPKRSYAKQQMTKFVWRFLLTCILLVALPSQGFAATGVSVCGPNHHQIFSSLSPVSNSGTSTLHDFPDEVSHYSASTLDAHDANGYLLQSSLSSKDPGSIGSTTNFNSNFKCKNCAPCCVSAVLPSEIVTYIATSGGGENFSTLFTVSALPPIAGLDRPPQFLLS